jgi:hypothetical protein
MEVLRGGGSAIDTVVTGIALWRATLTITVSATRACRT